MDIPLNDTLADDLLNGAAAIAEHMGPSWTPRRVFYAAERKYLPIFRLGNRLCARKSTLRRRMEDLEQAQRDGGGDAVATTPASPNRPR